LNYALVDTQERLEQKEFVLDEKEIEIMERDELAEQLRQKLTTAEQLSASQESKNAELLATFEQEIDFPKSAVCGSWKRRTFVTRKRAKFTGAFLLR
jgi:hypothetical protein